MTTSMVEVKRRTMARVALVLIALFSFGLITSPGPAANAAAPALPAFPGAEGFGYASVGGRGGEVYHVDSRELTGPGTFHDALTGAGPVPRTIIFDIGGEITIPQIIVRNKARITIAGQTAPGDGVTIAGNNIRFYNSSDIVVRHVRFRMTDRLTDDTMYFEDCQNVIIDHSSFSWGADEVLSVKSKNYDLARSKNISVQWSIISEGLLTHSMGGLVEMNTISMHHNLYAHNNDRNPKTKGPMDFVNNVVYNWGDYAYVAGGESGAKSYGNVVGNYFVAGANSTEPEYAIFRGNENYQIFLDNNRLDSNLNRVLDGVDVGTDIMEADRPSVVVPQRFDYPPVHTESPEEAHEHVLEYAGASLKRDAVDRRVTAGVRYQTGVIIGEEGDVGGFPELNAGTAAADSDRDGMPDAWEVARGLDPNAGEDRNGDDNGNGYTNLEEYLNELAAPGFPSGYPMTPVEWDGTPFEPPVAPREAPEPLPPLSGNVARSVTVNDTSASGSANAALWSVESNLQVGDVTNGDRDYKFTGIPESLIGSEWIRSAVESRAAENDDLVTFHVARDSEIYVAHDNRISPPPGWLASGYQDTGIVITDSQPITYRLFKRMVSAGTRVVMGPNNGGKRMNYFVILRPTSPDTALAAPAALNGSVVDGTATLSWNPTEGASAYVIYRASLSDPHWRSVATTADPGFVDQNLTAGMPYRYRVAAVGTGGESATTEPAALVAFDDAQEPPAAPGAPELTTRSYSVELNWPAVEGAIGYAVQRAAADGGFAAVEHTARPAFADASVQPGTKYRYRVTALGAGGESTPSEVVEGTTGGPLEMPTPPFGLEVSGIGHSSVSLTWEAVTDAETYGIERRADDTDGFKMIGSSNTAGYVDDSVAPSATGYSYRIVALNERGNSSPSAEVRALTPIPAAPTGLKVGLAGETFVGLIWKPGPGAGDHLIYRSQPGQAPVQVGNENVSTFYDRTVEPGQKYTYSIRAVNAAGESEPSVEVTVRTYAAGLQGENTQWAAEESYKSGDLVSFEGRTWVAQRNSSEKEPGALQGPWMEAGELVTGELGSQRSWTSTWAYSGGEIVSHDGAWWQAQKESRGVVPGTPHESWRKVS